MIEIQKRSLIIKLREIHLNQIDKIKSQFRLFSFTGTITLLFITGNFISFSSNAYGFNIRVQASDFLLPMVLIAAFNKNVLKDVFKLPETKHILFIFTGLFLTGIAVHWLNFGATNFWGIKKIIGWSICIGYFLAGFLLYEKRQNIVQTFIISAWFTGTLCLIGCLFSSTQVFFAPGLNTKLFMDI